MIEEPSLILRLSMKDQALLGQCLLLLKMEMPSIDSSKFNDIIEDLLLVNQKYNNVFVESEFSQYCTKVLNKHFYDFIKTDQYTAISKVKIVYYI